MKYISLLHSIKIFFETLVVAHLFKNCPLCMEPEGSTRRYIPEGGLLMNRNVLLFNNMIITAFIQNLVINNYLKYINLRTFSLKSGRINRWCHTEFELDSSVSLMYDYGLDDRAIGVRSLAEAKDFSCSLCVQTGSGAHPASFPVGTCCLFPGAKCGPSLTLTTHHHLVPRS
jgi:hypothetical protein